MDASSTETARHKMTAMTAMKDSTATTAAEVGSFDQSIKEVARRTKDGKCVLVCDK